MCLYIIELWNRVYGWSEERKNSVNHVDLSRKKADISSKFSRNSQRQKILMKNFASFSADFKQTNKFDFLD